MTAAYERDPAYIAGLYRRAEYWERQGREEMARGLQLLAERLERQANMAEQMPKGAYSVLRHCERPGCDFETISRDAHWEHRLAHEASA